MQLFSVRNLVVSVSLGCIALVLLQLLHYDLAAAAAKLLASTAFLAIALQVGGVRSPYGRLILLGLACSWFGDALLVGKSQDAFLYGLGAFLLAHVAYIAAFVVKGINPIWAAAAVLPVAALAVVVSKWLAPSIPAEMVVPVRAYTAVISMMLIAAIGTQGRAASRLIVAGALLFFISDLSVAALRLVQTPFPTYIWGLPLYYAGQVLLALSTAQSRSH